MRVHGVLLFCSLFAATGWAQTNDPPVVGPSPMEAFAGARGVRTAWSSELARWESEGTRVAITAIVLENSTPVLRRIRGVRIDLSRAAANDRIYLDEPALERTRKAMQSIAQIAGPGDNPGGGHCFGAQEFVDRYDWPWNKYHELNVNFCGGREQAVLYLNARGQDTAFAFAGKKPRDLGEIVDTAMNQLPQH